MSTFLTQQPFCEYYTNDQQLPELSNSITSLAYTIISIIIWKFSHVPMIYTGKLLIVLLFLLGVSSFMFHYTLWNIMGNMDVLFTLSVSYFGTFLCVESLLYYFLHEPYKSHFTIFSLLIICGAYLLSIGIWFLPGGGIYQFYELVALPQVFVLISILIINFCYYLNIFQNNFYILKSIVYANIGTFILLSVAIIPIIVGKQCENIHFNTHALWHVGSAYGIYLLIQSFIFIRLLYHTNGNVSFERNGLIGYIFPCIKYYKY